MRQKFTELQSQSEKLNETKQEFEDENIQLKEQINGLRFA